MYNCPLCLKSFDSPEELNQHFQENEECRGFAKKMMYSASLLPTLDVDKRIDIFLKTHTNSKILIADGDRHIYTEITKEG